MKERKNVKEKEKGSSSSSVEKRYKQWKTVIPLLYDWIINHILAWPSPSCRWGAQLEQGTYKNSQRLFISEQTDGTVPNTLVIANCEIVKPRIAAAEHICQFNEKGRSPFVKKSKTIVHPGEVNKIRELPQYNRIVATHTNSPKVYIWDVNAQPNRSATPRVSPSLPDLVLTGHEDNAEFALGMCPTEPFVLSGGGGPIANQSSSSREKVEESRSIGPRGIYKGHEGTVEDVQFCPSSEQEFCSVGDDSCLILWDARVGSTPAMKVEKAHVGDVYCVDWSPHDVNFILTGAADNTIHMFDRRKLNIGGVGSPIHEFEGHSAAVLCVQWNPNKSSVFGSSGEDSILNIWDLEKVGNASSSAGLKEQSSPPGLFFQHVGHRDKVVDFHWNAFDPWTIVSVSDDCGRTGGGGTLQIWRPIDFLCRPEEEVLAELEDYKAH
ncbi:hypothetical protein RIF29_09768 [Crotalaria pallida]|uniref:Histone-binding protein RBBP4-like N-terminal domain-containing protein n=1 Tax=Crotalaria pallida TaxID=3830 RepID=A0AAN9FS86_CROPI